MCLCPELRPRVPPVSCLALLPLRLDARVRPVFLSPAGRFLSLLLYAPGGGLGLLPSACASRRLLGGLGFVSQEWLLGLPCPWHQLFYRQDVSQAFCLLLTGQPISLTHFSLFVYLDFWSLPHWQPVSLGFVFGVWQPLLHVAAPTPAFVESEQRAGLGLTDGA